MFNQVRFIDAVACKQFTRAVIASSQIVLIQDGELKLCPECEG
jgi:hypothetical protein